MLLFLAKMAPTEIAIIGVLATAVILLAAIGILRQRRSRRRTSAGYYVEALKDLIRGDEENAFGHLKMVVMNDSDNIDAYLRLGDIFRHRGELGKALQLHRQLTVRGDLNLADRKELLKSLTTDYLEAKKEERATATLEELLSLDKKNLWALRQLLQLHEKGERWSRALATQETIFKNTGEKDDTLLALYEVQMGHQLASQKQYHKARLNYKDALRRDRQCVPAYLGLGDAYQREGRLDEAVESWKDLLARVPQKAYLVFERLEKTLFDQGKFNEVSKLYRELLEKDPHNTQALLALAKIQEKKGDLDQAIETCRRALRIEPRLLAARQLMVQLYGQRGDQDRIVATLKDLVHQYPREFICTNCGYRSGQPLWHCPQCGQWRSFEL